MTATEEETKIIEDINDSSHEFYDSRENVLSRLDEVIKILHTKATSGRVKNPNNEKVRIQWFRVLAYTCSIYNQIKRDVEMDELKEEIETLKNQIKSLDTAPKRKEGDDYYG